MATGTVVLDHPPMPVSHPAYVRCPDHGQTAFCNARNRRERLRPGLCGNERSPRPSPLPTNSRRHVIIRIPAMAVTAASNLRINHLQPSVPAQGIRFPPLTRTASTVAPSVRDFNIFLIASRRPLGHRPTFRRCKTGQSFCGNATPPSRTVGKRPQDCR